MSVLTRVCDLNTSNMLAGTFYYHSLTFVPAWISNYIHYKVRGEIIYPFQRLQSWNLGMDD